MIHQSTRQTCQRAAVLNYLKDTRTHPPAKIIYREIKKKLPQVSRATVYRNLRILQQQGKVKAVEVAGTARFESLSHEPHHHFICTLCQNISDIHVKKLNEKILPLVKKQHPTLRAESAVVLLAGVCKNCKTTGGKNDTH